MKYLYCVSMLIYSAVAVFCNAQELESNDSDQGNAYEGEKIEGLWSIEDIESLGCKPKDGKGKYITQDNPVFGTMYVYSFKSQLGCPITVFNMIVPVLDEDPGAWAAMRGRASSVARKRGFKKNHREGNVGDYSEVYEYTLNGKPQGLYYIIQLDNLLSISMIISEGITVDDKIEQILFRNILRVRM